nr:hypothetical protein [Trichocoleus desertorum]
MSLPVPYFALHGKIGDRTAQQNRSNPSHVERTGSRILGSLRPTSSNV